MLTREQLQERLIALHRASLELVRETSLQRLLELIGSTACEQVGARYGAVGVLDENGALKEFVPVGMTSQEIGRMSHPPLGKGLIRRLMNTHQPLRVPLISGHPDSSGFPRNHPPMTSFLGVPIRTADRQLGQIYLTNKLGEPEFSADDESILQMLAGYAAAAIQNALLLEEMAVRDRALTRRSEDLAVLNDIGSVLASSLEPDQILNKTLAVVMNYMKVETGAIFLLDDDKQTLRLVLHRGHAADAFWSRNRFPVGEGTVGEVAKSGEARVTGDLEPSASDADKQPAAGFTQTAYLPMRSGDAVVGVICVATRSREKLDPRGLELIGAVGNWAGLSLENGQLHQNVRRLAVLEERDRIGMDLHDGIIQSVYGVGLGLVNALQTVDEDTALAKARIQDSIDGLNQAIRDIRAYILDLQPRQMGAEGLMAGLRRLGAEYRANTFSDVVLKGPEHGLEQVPQSNTLTLFHICQEALANAAKHAGAKHVDVNVWMTADRVMLEVHDDGAGFATEKMSTTIGHGLSNMLTRAHSVSGDVDITSAPGEGTTVLAWVPRRGRA